MRQSCSVDGCGGQPAAQGLCRKHYMRLWRTGTTELATKKARRLCTVEDCFRPHQALGLCRHHWRQQYTEKRRTEDRARNAADRAARICLECQGPVPIERNTRALYCSLRCKNRALGRGRSRTWQLRTNHGMTEAEYDAMLAAQGGRCAICGTDDPRGRGSWHVDHNHATGATRGLLCNDCNVGLGIFKDDPVLLGHAAEYLDQRGCSPRSVPI